MSDTASGTGSPRAGQVSTWREEGGTAADAPAAPMRCLTIDVEEDFHVEAARGIVSRASWADRPRRAEANVERLLDLLNRSASRATFFFLGDVARHCPTLARRCADAGHEVACHGDLHDRLHRLDRSSLRQDLLTSKGLLEDQIGAAVRGYRAPTWSVTRDTAWAIEVIRDAGFEWDASIFAVRHPWYGVADAPTKPYYVRPLAGGAPLLELPPLTWRAAGRNVAVAGGGYFRLLPGSTWLMRRGLRQAELDGRPAIIYFHPWEFDAGGPRLPLPPVARLRTYTGVRTAEQRLEGILQTTGPWRAIADHLDAMRMIAESSPAFDIRMHQINTAAPHPMIGTTDNV